MFTQKHISYLSNLFNKKLVHIKIEKRKTFTKLIRSRTVKNYANIMDIMYS